MKRLAFLLALSVTWACSSPAPMTGPKPGLDPILLVTNQLQGTDGAQHGDTAYVTWRDQSGQVTTNFVPPASSMCIHFTPTTQTDSVQITVAVGSYIDTPQGGGGIGAIAGPSLWMVPGQHEDWSADVLASMGVLLKEVAQPPC